MWKSFDQLVIYVKKTWLKILLVFFLFFFFKFSLLYEAGRE